MTSGTIEVETHGTVLVADYPPGEDFGPRTLTSFELVWLLAGTARHIWSRPHPDGSVEQGETRLPPGRLVLVTPGTRDSFRWDRRRATRHAYLHFMINGSERLPPTWQWPMVRDLDSAPVLHGLCAYLLELAGHGTPAARRRSDQLVGLLVDLYVTGPLAEPADRSDSPTSAVVEYVRGVWADDGMRIVPVAEVCAAVGLSPGHLHRLFRERYGLGPARAFELVRLARGAVALQRSNAGLAELARLVGFSNPYHFSRRFRRVYGVPPGRYRRDPEPVDPLAPLRRAGLLPLAGPLLNG